MTETPIEAAIGDKAARELMLSELLRVCTPAPWRLNIYGGVSDKNGNDIRATGLALTNSEVAKNNSQLISLAPSIAADLLKERAINTELLEALQALLAVVNIAATDKSGNKHQYLQTVEGSLVFAESASILSEFAIAKALGERA